MPQIITSWCELQQCKSDIETTIFFSSSCTHAAAWFIHRYQQKEDSLHEFNFEYSECIQGITSHESKDIMAPLKIAWMHRNDSI